MLKQTAALSTLLMLAACQSLPAPEKPVQVPKVSEPKKTEEIRTPTGVVIKPYEPEEIRKQKLQVIVPEQKSKQQFDDGRNLPAFKSLMKQAHDAYAKENWNAAETAALHAQRLAPQSAETYLYLAMIANRKNKPADAESLARRGLSYAQTNAMKKQLWLAVLRSAQLQKKTTVIQQAQTALKQL